MHAKFEKDPSKGAHFRGEVKVLGWNDGRTDRLTDGQFKNYMPPFGGIKNLKP